MAHKKKGNKVKKTSKKKEKPLKINGSFLDVIKLAMGKEVKPPKPL
jgi:hypothetical protein